MTQQEKAMTLVWIVITLGALFCLVWLASYTLFRVMGAPMLGEDEDFEDFHESAT